MLLKKLLVMYMSFMATGSTGLIPHIVGPPGAGKSTVVKQLAQLLGVEMHIISVSRLNSLEVEGVQMPVVVDDEYILRMLPAAFWTRLKEGDIVFYDEFLGRGFDEVYNALLDIFTSRSINGKELPRVFMVAASNTVTTYDDALADRIVDIHVPDPRKLKTERKRMVEILVNSLGLHPEVATDASMDYLMDDVVLPTFDVLDHMSGKGRKTGDKPRKGGKSLRNLISQVELRYVVTPQLKEVIETSNRLAMRDSKPQYVIVLGKAPDGYEDRARKLVGNPRLTEVQAVNLQLNLDMIDLEKARFEKEEEEDRP